MADPKWLPRCYKISMELLIVPMEYIFTYAKKDVIAEKNEGIKNSKEKRKSSAKKWRSEKVLINLFFYKKKSNQQENTEKNI